MRLVITQPSYWPWLPYLRRIARADVCVSLNHVALDRSSKTNYVNRARVLNGGAGAWLTIPLDKKEHRVICGLQPVSNDKRHWFDGHLDMLSQAYRKAPHYDEVMQLIKGVAATAHMQGSTLSDVTEMSMYHVCAGLGIATTILPSNRMEDVHQYTGNQLILELCKKYGATSYIAGRFAKDYLDVAAFDAAGIQLEYDDWMPSPYAQLGGGEFTQGLSCIDALMNIGLKDTRTLLEL